MSERVATGLRRDSAFRSATGRFSRGLMKFPMTQIFRMRVYAHRRRLTDPTWKEGHVRTLVHGLLGREDVPHPSRQVGDHHPIGLGMRAGGRTTLLDHRILRVGMGQLEVESAQDVTIVFLAADGQRKGDHPRGWSFSLQLRENPGVLITQSLDERVVFLRCDRQQTFVII
ncbi:MAG: hypothetical protein GY895_03505 [Phycisphaera sp.]|nr:hypothetical protein [Phycisphaera sp.]